MTPSEPIYFKLLSLLPDTCADILLKFRLPKSTHAKIIIAKIRLLKNVAMPPWFPRFAGDLGAIVCALWKEHCPLEQILIEVKILAIKIVLFW